MAVMLCQNYTVPLFSMVVSINFILRSRPECTSAIAATTDRTYVKKREKERGWVILTNSGENEKQTEHAA